MRKRSLIYLSHGPLGHRTTWQFIPTIHLSPSSVLNFHVSNICLCLPTSPSRLTHTQNYVTSIFAFRLSEIRLCVPSQKNTSLHSASVLAFLFRDTYVWTINLGEGGPIRLSFPSQGDPPVPSACAIRLGDIPLGLPSRGQPAIQDKQIHLMITHRPALTNDSTLVLSEISKRQNHCNSSSLQQETSYNYIIKHTSHEKTCSFCHPLLYTHPYTPAQSPTNTHTRHCHHHPDWHIAALHKHATQS